MPPVKGHICTHQTMSHLTETGSAFQCASRLPNRTSTICLFHQRMPGNKFLSGLSFCRISLESHSRDRKLCRKSSNTVSSYTTWDSCKRPPATSCSNGRFPFLCFSVWSIVKVYSKLLYCSWMQLLMLCGQCSFSILENKDLQKNMDTWPRVWFQNLILKHNPKREKKAVTCKQP